IHDNDGPDSGGDDYPKVSIAATDPTAAEEGAVHGTFTVSRSGSTDGALSVTVVFAGTADDPDDYSLDGAAVTIPDGAASVSFDVVPVDDGLAEGDETVIAHISGGGDPASDGYSFDP